MRRTPILATALLALVLAGCSSTPASTESAPAESPSQSDSPSDAASPDTAPADGETISGDGYSFSLPSGWAVPTDQAPPTGVDTFAADLEDADGFADNVNVVLSPSGEVTSDQVETLGLDELEGAGATEVEVLERTTVAGAEAAHLTALLSASGAEYRIDQYYPSHDGQTYVVTFSFNDTVPEAERSALADAVLGSWEWA
jgi:hypothetical protein